MHTTQPNNVCPPVAMERLSSIGGIQSGERVRWIAPMVFDMPNQVPILVCDLHIAKVVGNRPVSNC